MAPKREDSNLSQDSTITIVPDRHEVLYFAYGSNLSTEQMRQRCPDSTPLGLAYMQGWKWLINERGYANVVRIPDSTSVPAAAASDNNVDGKGKGGSEEKNRVYGLLYFLPQGDEAKLDVYEGYDWAYGKQMCDARMILDDQRKQLDIPVKVLVYVDENNVKESDPKDEYVLRMERGIEDAVSNWCLDEEYANTVMRRFWKKM
ncbi:hypothetical protein QQS21_008514 [Conoideocrella luteorostrata]|uniref:gamma-glutamylcyclotransferase n=1 Tax=Conoideocrella luteorostrata TaxID=1105319 RepID=A0AAJ0CIN5_9HYPO|nr:hypothetical protein QQS21_008514 [Conoideocrella luteorostrata]